MPTATTPSEHPQTYGRFLELLHVAFERCEVDPESAAAQDVRCALDWLAQHRPSEMRELLHEGLEFCTGYAGLLERLSSEVLEARERELIGD